MRKSKEEKLKEQEELERQEKLEEEREERERELEAEKKWQEEIAKFRQGLDEQAKKDDVVCVFTEYCNLKQIAITHLFQKGYVCVQNDIACNKWGTKYILTFATGEAVNKFVRIK